MHLDAPESISSAKPAPRVLAKISFDRQDKARSSDIGNELSTSPIGRIHTPDAESNPMAAEENFGDGIHVSDCSSEYFLG